MQCIVYSLGEWYISTNVYTLFCVFRLRGNIKTYIRISKLALTYNMENKCYLNRPNN